MRIAEYAAKLFVRVILFNIDAGYATEWMIDFLKEYDSSLCNQWNRPCQKVNEYRVSGTSSWGEKLKQ